jgi:hypothetical protein
MIRTSQASAHFHDYDKPYTVELSNAGGVSYIDVRTLRNEDELLTLFFDSAESARIVSQALKLALKIDLAADQQARLDGASDATSDAELAPEE